MIINMTLIIYCNSEIMKINTTPKRIFAMIGIGIVLILILYAIGIPHKAIGSLTGGILFFVWMWLGGKWW